MSLRKNWDNSAMDCDGMGRCFVSTDSGYKKTVQYESCNCVLKICAGCETGHPKYSYFLHNGLCYSCNLKRSMVIGLST